MKTESSYMPQLDGIRTCAIFGVLVSHFLTGKNYIQYIAHWGRLGVILFFVLSGFLITGILLRYRDACLVDGSSRRHALRTFYIRRTLRIFPIYYLAILVMTLLDYAPVRDNLFYHLTYTSNFSASFSGENYAYATHLWSLCVEEQFYLLWPFVVIFAPKRLLRKITLGIIAGAVIYKAASFCGGFSWAVSTRPIFAVMDSLGLGALLAISRHQQDLQNDPAKSKLSLPRIGLAVGLPSLIALQFLWSIPSVDSKSNFAYVVLVDLAASLSYIALIDSAARKSSRLFFRFLGWAPVRYIGKISYGIYLYHFFLIFFLPKAFSALGIQAILAGLPQFPVYTTATVALAALSWHLVEKPINDFKKRFSYV